MTNNTFEPEGYTNMYRLPTPRWMIHEDGYASISHWGMFYVPDFALSFQKRVNDFYGVAE